VLNFGVNLAGSIDVVVPGGNSEFFCAFFGELESPAKSKP